MSSLGVSMEQNAPRTLHERLRAVIVANIGSGAWAPHSQITSERELCQRYGVSRATTRKVVSDLVHEGVIYTVAGKGAFVSDRPFRQELKPLTGFAEDLQGQGIAMGSTVRRFERIEADETLAGRLRIRPGSAVVHLERLRFADGKPVAVQTSFIPEHLCPGLLHIDFSRASLYETFRGEYGLSLGDADTVVRPDLAQDWEAALSGGGMPLPVLRTFQTTYLTDGRVIEYCLSTFFGNGFELTVGSSAHRGVCLSPTRSEAFHGRGESGK
ncbi:MAG: GntR family transcriptional regulator [Rhizobiales bacterium]|nr:GntR family transcriptional regulator [Hyphomicrobiales bacterium]